MTICMAMKAASVLQHRDATGGQYGLVFVLLQEVRARGAVVSGGRG